MGSLWNHTFPDMKNYFRSLSALSGSFNFGLKVDIQVVCLHVDVYFGLLYLITLSSPNTPYDVLLNSPKLYLWFLVKWFGEFFLS